MLLDRADVLSHVQAFIDGHKEAEGSPLVEYLLEHGKRVQGIDVLR